MRRPFIGVAAVCATLWSVANAQDFNEVRRHFAVRETDTREAFPATEIVQLTKDHDTNVVAIQGDRATLLLLTRERDYRRQDASYEIRDPRRKAFVRLSFELPFAARTRDETIAEARTRPQASKPLALTIETSGIVLSMSEGEWKDRAKSREWKTQIRESLDPAFLESLERMRGVFRADPRLSAFNDSLLVYVLHGGRCGDDSEHYSIESIAPDCEFDAGAGFPCREEQRERVTRAAKENRVIDTY